MFNIKSIHLGHLAKSFGMREAPGASTAPKGKKRTKGKAQTGSGTGGGASDKEMARAIAALKAKGRGDGGFETGRRHDEQRAAKRNHEKMMKGPTGEGSGDYQVAGADLIEMLAKGRMVSGTKRKR